MNVRDAKLGDVAQFIRGITFKPDDLVPLGAANSVACLRTKNVQTDLDLSDVWAIPESFVKDKGRLCREGDLIMSTANSWNLVGKASWVPDLDWPTAVGGFVSLLRADEKVVAPRYLFHWITSGRTQAALRSCARQTTNISNLSLAQAADLQIPLPPLEEQKRIAAILDQADALRRLRRRALDRLNTLGHAIFHEMFGNPSVVKGSYDIKYLEEFVDPKRPITYGILKPGPDIPDGVPYVRVVDMNGKSLVTSGMRRTSAEIASAYKRSCLEAGDLLMSIRGHVGRTCIVPDELAGANITQDTARLAVPPDQAEYFRYSILHPASQEWMRRRTRGAAVQGLNLGDLRQLPVRDAPISDRVHFSQRIASSTVSLQSYTRASHFNERFFASLQHRAFSREL